jgi:hypothetical protein
MAVANTMAAVWAGASSIDASLRGIGRAAGNAQLEAVVALLKRAGYAGEIDLDRLLAAGEDVVAKLMPPAKGLGMIDLLTADANIDLYPLPLYERIAAEAGIPLEVLIRTLGAHAVAVEIGPDEVKEALRALNVDPEAVFAALGFEGG